MGTLSLTHWLVVLLVVLLVFGAGKMPQLMGELAQGIRIFKSGLKEKEPAPLPKVAADSNDRNAA